MSACICQNSQEVQHTQRTPMQTMDFSESQCISDDSSVVTTYLTNASCYTKRETGEGGDIGAPRSAHVCVNLKQLQK